MGLKLSRTLKIITAAAFIMNLSACDTAGNNNKRDIVTFTSYMAINGVNIDKDNDIQEYIARKTGARCIETWKNPNQSAQDMIEDMIISQKYPDFIYGGVGQQQLLDANALIPLNEYWDDYENIKSYFTEKEWNRLKDDEGHIYYIPSYDNVYMEDTSPMHNEQAFWIQVKVLEWGGYPEINTLDQYFDLIERYLKENPIGANGEPNIGYEILTDGYMYFCLENPPQFLDGYPNDGSCIVDAENHIAVDYNITDTAKRWFRKLNEEYKKGVVDPQFSFLTTEQYYEKIRSGNVLGMVDQYWSFSDAEDLLPPDSKYVPLDLVIDEGIVPHYRSARTLDVSQGMGISVSCDDIERAMKFLDDLLSPEIHTLRFWGIEGEDYMVDEKGVFYRTALQREMQDDESYIKKHFCRYYAFPFYLGMNQDGINAYSPDNQPEEYFSTLGTPLMKCFEAYGVNTPAEMINAVEENAPWYPMWSHTNRFTTDTDYGRAKAQMDDVKHRYLPKVVMSGDFESAWKEYLEEYEKCDTRSYFNELTAEIRRRAGS